MLNAIFTTTIYKSKFQVSFGKCYMLVKKGSSNDIYTVTKEDDF